MVGSSGILTRKNRSEPVGCAPNVEVPPKTGAEEVLVLKTDAVVVAAVVLAVAVLLKRGCSTRIISSHSEHFFTSFFLLPTK